jgi:hypothetical protein
MHFRLGMVLICWLSFESAVRCAADETAVSPFLLNMPQNSNMRCVGIAGVAEALLEGTRQDTALTNIDSLARLIYQSFTSTESLEYPPRLMMKGKSIPIEDKTALTALSNRVAEFYKADYHRMSRSPEGVRQLLNAQGKVVRTTGELDEILAADSDKTVFFCCFGQRTFPDHEVKDTNHAVLLRPAPHNGYLVYDPNDPGAAIECSLEETSEGLIISWKCKYRDQEVETTQHYRIVPQAAFFQVLK